ncbi:AraC family transcriptional regulator [Paenibacillus agaridevorans]|uniref:AraC family transcriptional regulator n=1 Tax=Paenibacillus agaridevorans TaxID=171404 RepID=A0A2R5EPT8_9BACL|nr:AraC family transcriptional regulator [Paenibacillus agaridevorans]GBG08597.1 AraC family transcriptional regulator [Paenibacillus agaridevorans]
MAVLSRIRFVEDLFVRMAWVIENVVDAETEFPRASYPKTIIWLVLDGTRTIEVNGNLREVRAGDIVVIPPQTPRIVLASDASASPFHYYTVGCDIKIGSLNFVELYNLPLIARIEDTSAFQELTRLTAKLLEQSLDVIKSLHALDQPQLIISKVNTDETVALLAVNASFNVWVARFFDMMRGYMPDKAQEIDPRISRLCNYMQMNLEKKLALPDLAAYLFISESHLRLLFRKTMGISPSEYLRQLRLQRAKDLLVNTTYSLSEIAELSGFQTLNHFSRMFKSNESIPATEYRKRYYGIAQG